MAISAANRQRVYLACRSIFSGANAKIRTRAAVNKVVRKHKSALESLADIQLGEIVGAALSLLKKEIFESDKNAQVEFPQLFQSMPAQDASRKASELKATQTFGDDLAMDATRSEEYDTKVGVAGKLEPPVVSKTNGQEECFYDFTRRWLPDVLEQEQCDCAISIELNEWARLIRKHEEKIPIEAVDPQGYVNMESILAAVSQIRHSAVHRNKLTGPGVNAMVAQGAAAASMLRDAQRSVRLETMAADLGHKITSMELVKNDAEKTTVAQLEDIAQRRAALDLEEETAVAEMLRRDADGTRSMGLLVEESVDRILRGPLLGCHGVAMNDAEEDYDEDEYIDADDDLWPQP